MDNIIKELKLQIGEKEVSLTVDEAKKLKAALDELFGKEVAKEVPSPYPVYPWWYWQYPVITWTSRFGEAWGGPYRIYSSGCTAAYDSNTSSMTLKVA